MKWQHWLFVAILIAAIYMTAMGVIKAKRKETIEGAAYDANVRAFLKMIRYAEGTDGAEGYHVTYGYQHYISSMADHPSVTGEWNGKQLPDAVCVAAGQEPGCKSTAAGAYQFTKPTWLECKAALDLPDFTPMSQDRAAIFLIQRRGALDLVKAGKFEEAVMKVNREWASLPGSPYGQPVKTMAQVKNYYQTSGGTATA